VLTRREEVGKTKERRQQIIDFEIIDLRKQRLEGNHPDPFLTKRPTPPEEGNRGYCNLKGTLLFRGLLRRLAPSRNDECAVERWSALQ